MSKKSLNAISPIDGRYSSKTENLSNFFSEKALIRYRVLVEIEYFISLTEVEIPGLSNWKSSDNKLIKNIYENFSDDDAIEIKKIEKTTNHDVKAVEYFLKEKFNDLGFKNYSEYIHFGLTSQDVNNTAIPLSIKDFLPSYYVIIEDLINELSIKVKDYSDIAMLARTHGQPASPTRLGKEINVFKSRIKFLNSKNDNINEVFYLSDILMTDFSSIFSDFLIFDKVGEIRFHSISASTSLDPGFVASPPISRIPHPSLISLLACKIPKSFLLYFPPSEKLFGVKFKTPIRIGNFESFRPLKDFFFVIFFISNKTFFLILFSFQSHHLIFNSCLIVSSLNLYPIFLAGFPIYIENGSIDLLITEPVARIEPDPTSTPDKILTLFPTQILLCKITENFSSIIFPSSKSTHPNFL